MSPNKVLRFNAVRNSYGAAGCGLSHIGVLEMALAKGWNNVLIAEDDFTWTDHVIHGYDILTNLIQQKYDVIVLGGTFIKSYKNSFKLINCSCALGYIVHKSYYKKLIKCFQKGVHGLLTTRIQYKYAIDVVWRPLQKNDNWYIIKPNMCKQLPSYSDIEEGFRDYDEYFIAKNIEEYNIEYLPDDIEQLTLTTDFVLSYLDELDEGLTFNVKEEPPIVDSDLIEEIISQEPTPPPKSSNIKPITISNKKFNGLQETLPPKELFQPTIIQHKDIPNLKFNIPENRPPKELFQPTIIQHKDIPNLRFNVEETPAVVKEHSFEQVVFEPPTSNIYFNLKENATKPSVGISVRDFLTVNRNFNDKEIHNIKSDLEEQINFQCQTRNKTFNGKEVIPINIPSDNNLKPIIISNKKFVVPEKHVTEPTVAITHSDSNSNLKRKPISNKKFIVPETYVTEPVVETTPQGDNPNFKCTSISNKKFNVLQSEILNITPPEKIVFKSLTIKPTSFIHNNEPIIKPKDPVKKVAIRHKSISKVNFNVPETYFTETLAITPPEKYVFTPPNINKSFDPKKTANTTYQGLKMVSLRQLISSLKMN